MRRAIAVLLTALAPALCPAQATANPQPSGVTVVGATWKFPANWRGEAPADVLSGASRTDTIVRGRRAAELEQGRGAGRLGPLDSEQRLYLRRGQNEAVLEARNDGPKQIRAVSYDFLFVSPEDGAELLRYQLRSRSDIKPGETRTLNSVVADRRAERLAPDTGGRVKCRAVIQRVGHADGSVWQRR